MKVFIIFFPDEKKKKNLKISKKLASGIEPQGYHPDELTARKVKKKHSIGT